jgi:hypothetical protein
MSATPDIPIHTLFMDSAHYFSLKPPDIEIKRFRIGVQIALLQRVLILEQQIVHGPKLTLGSGGFCGFRGLLSKGMFMSQWEMAKDEPQTICESSLESFDGGICARAVGAFKIAVGHHGDCRSIGPSDMVIVLDRKSEFGIDGGLAHWRSLLAASTDLSGNRAA